MGINRQSTRDSGLESGYASGASSTGSLPLITLSKAHLKHINSTLNELDPLSILRWAKITFPNLYQTTAFGVSGLVTLDMLSKLQAESPSSPSIDGIFLDTLYHFQETHDLIARTKARYPNINLHIYKPEDVNTTAEFEAKHGRELWKTNADLYDWVAKVEPAQRAYSDLSVAAILTGRRRSQGAKRESLDIVEVTDEGLIKINPLAAWSFAQVEAYIREHNVPYNELLDRGYKSVGDWHSTEPVAAGEDERAGRWKGAAKTECGIHNKKSKYAIFLAEMERKRQQEELTRALEEVEIKGREEVVEEEVKEVEVVEASSSDVAAVVAVVDEVVEISPSQSQEEVSSSSSPVELTPAVVEEVNDVLSSSVVEDFVVVEEVNEVSPSVAEVEISSSSPSQSEPTPIVVEEVKQFLPLLEDLSSSSQSERTPIIVEEEVKVVLPSPTVVEEAASSFSSPSTQESVSVAPAVVVV